MASHRIRARQPAPVPAPPVARDAATLAGVREDAAHYPGGRASGVVHPRSEAEVAAVVREAPRVLPIGAQSSLTGGATPVGDVVVATDRMDRIVALGPGEVTVEPGVPLAVLQEELHGAGAWYPPRADLRRRLRRGCRRDQRGRRGHLQVTARRGTGSGGSASCWRPATCWT